MLEVKNISKRYIGKKVLNDVSFTARSGEICGIIGENGSGKSTLLKIICSEVKADSGDVLLGGADAINFEAVKKDIGFMREYPVFYNGLTGRQNLLLLAGLYPDASKCRVDVVLRKTGLYEYAGELVDIYTIGMKQRLSFAYAMLAQPKVLCLDEPFNGMEAVEVEIVYHLIKELAVIGHIVIISGGERLKEFCNKIIAL